MSDDFLNAVSEFPMSVGQRALWFEQLAQPSSNAYNLVACMRFPRAIDRAALQGALHALSSRHPLLRARFTFSDQGPRCTISRTALPCHELATLPTDADKAIGRCEFFLLRPYDLAAEDPFRLGVIDVADGGAFLAIGAHHIVMDLHSTILILHELAALYKSAAIESHDAVERVSYTEFCRWQRTMLDSSEGQAAAEFWQNQLKGYPGPLGMLESAHRSVASIEGASRIQLAITREDREAIEQAAAASFTTPFVVLLTAMQALLAAGNKSPAALVGTPTSGRNNRRFRHTVGYFVNLLPMLVEVDPQEAFATMLAANGKRVRDALRYGQYPFASMVEQLRGRHGAAPLVQATLTFQKSALGLDSTLARVALQLPGGGLTLGSQFGELVPLRATMAQFPLGIGIAAADDGYIGCLDFDPTQVTRALAEQFCSEWLALVISAARDPGRSVSALLGSATACRNEQRDLASALEHSLATNADRPAVVNASEEWTYRQLATRSGAVVEQLRAAGVHPGQRVAVIGDGDVMTVCAMLGVLRTGAAFVSIDADIDLGRMRTLIEAAHAEVVLDCTPAMRLGRHLTSYTVLSPRIAETAIAVPSCGCGPLDTAWVMFTSGTTGTPKAAIVPHEAALAHARGIVARFALTTRDRVLQFASLSFDEHAEEIFPTLLAGACVVCAPRVRMNDPETLLRLVQQSAISVLHLPTSYWHLWMDEAAHATMPSVPSLRLVNTGGEQPSVARLRTWSQVMSPSVRWINTYGLTEAAVTSLVWEFEPDAGLHHLSRVPAGTPLAGSRIRIVSVSMHDVPASELGELLLGGVGVGLGYLEPSAAAANFFSVDGVRWLRTGDLAYLDTGGNVVLAGRRDRVLKIRGARFDPAELEAAIAKHPAVLESVVTFLEDEVSRDAGELELHVAVREGNSIAEADLREYWQQSLPGVAVPSVIVFHRTIPRTAGLKPDFARLRPTRPSLHTYPEPDDDRLTQLVTAIFVRLLQRPIAADANFFALGGHSLLAMRLVAALRRELQVELSIADFLARPTLRAVVAHCRRNAIAPLAVKSVENESSSYPLSRAQRRALLLAEVVDESAARAIAVVQIEGAIDRARLHGAWRSMVHRHRLLTATIDDAGNTENDIDGALYELAAQVSLPRKRSALARAARELFLRETDPGASLAGTLLETSNGVVLVVGARHVAADGGSLSLLVHEIAHGCGPSHVQLSPAASYRRFVAAESEWLASPAHAAARAYWEECLEGDPTPTRLASMELDNATNFRSRRIGVTLASRLQDQVFSLARDEHCTPFAVLLASFLVLLARYSANEEVLIGVPVSLRELFGVPDVVGPTLNPLPFRIRVRQDQDFAALVRDVHARLAAAFQHGALPVEEMVARAPSLRGAPLPIQFVAQQTMFSVGEHAPTLRVLSERDGQSPIALLAGVHLARWVRLELEYRTAPVNDAFAVCLLDAWRILLRELCAARIRPTPQARMVSRRYLERAVAVVDPLRANDRCLHDGLREHAALHPERVALIGEGRQLSYSSLDAISNRYAARLVAAGVAKGDRVIIASRKGLAECIAAIAILKVGAAYVPIAWDLPLARAKSMAARVGAWVVTGAPELGDFARETGATFIAVDLDESVDAPCVERKSAPTDSAYVLFTSGSTGEPKGVEVTHAAAMVTINEILRRFDIGARDVLYGNSALGFDLSVFDLFGAFTAGACVVLPSGDTRFDAFTWARDVLQHNVSVWNSVPSALDMLLDAAPSGSLRSLRRLLVSGDRIGLDLPGRAACACPGATFVALGGATEAGIWSNCHIVERVEPNWRSIPYGRALAGQSMFVVDSTGWPVPPGVAGEICIGGGALARGYFGDAALTAAKFLWHDQSSQRIYRTGDQGRYFEDGSIEFLGRVDRQIKLRGHRIEAGDVEVAMAACPGVRRVLVNVIGNDVLVAFIVPDDSATIDQGALHRHAEERLPEYMRPSRFEVVKHVPLTANGKIDWNALADCSHATGAREFDVAVPLSVTERRIAAVWEAVLPGRAVRRNDDFFAAGGHSLLAVRLIARIQREFHLTLPLSRWLREPTLAHLGRMVDAHDELDYERVKNNSALRAHVRLAEDVVFAPPRAQPGGTLITGASGLIGTRLLVACLQRNTSEILCLVRDTPEHRPENAIAQHLAQRGIDASWWRLRVRWVRGDLALPRFGLSTQAFAEIAASVATVFHVGATVNLVAPYESLARVNVDGTHEAIRLAALAGATLHHVSSIGVLPYGKGKLITETDSIDGPGTLLTGYCQTKWVAEQIVRRAAARGLRAAIYRPGLTLAERPTGDDLLHALASLMMHVRALPDLDVPIDLVGADYVASAMLQISTDERSIGGTFHLTHPHPVMLAAAMQRLRLVGIGLPLLPFVQWRAKLEEALPDIRDPRHAAIAALIASQDEAELTPAQIDCSRCCALLQGTEVQCESVMNLLAPRLRELTQIAGITPG